MHRARFLFYSEEREKIKKERKKKDLFDDLMSCHVKSCFGKELKR